MMRKEGFKAYQRGLTLIELMVALTLSFIIVGAVYRAFTSQQRAYTIQDQLAEAQQSARVAMNILMRDLRMAGHGKGDGNVVIGGQEYSHSIEVATDPDNEGSYIITLVGCFGTPKGYLTKTADKDETQIWVRSTGNELSEIFEESNHIFIGGMAKMTVAEAPVSKHGMLTLEGSLTKRYPTGILSGSVETGATTIPLKNTDGLRGGDVLFLGQDRLIVIDVGTDTITIDTDPDVAGNQGISGNYPAETYVNPIPIYRLTALVYSIEIDDRGIPYLSRNDKVEGNLNRRLAEHIEKLVVKPNSHDEPLYTITLVARTRVKDPDYKDEDRGYIDGYRRRILESQVTLRNL